MGQSKIIIENKKEKIELPVDVYSKNLIYYLQEYLDLITIENTDFSNKANIKAKIILRKVIAPNDYSIDNDYRKIEGEIGGKTITLLNNYTRAIMQILGSVCECIVVDMCNSDKNINKMCINLAMLKDNIEIEYDDIDYTKFVAASTSHKYIINGDKRIKRENIWHNKTHPTKDIFWCGKNEVRSKLKVVIEEIGYCEDAQLQVKCSKDYENIRNISQYSFSPIMYFDILNDSQYLIDKIIKEKLPVRVVSVRNFNFRMIQEAENYFKILAAYCCGLIGSLDELNSSSIAKNAMLKYLFDSSIEKLLRANIIDDRCNIKDIIVNGTNRYNDELKLSLLVN